MITNARELVNDWVKNRRNIGVKLANKGKFAHDTVLVTSIQDYGHDEIYVTVTYLDGTSYANYLVDDAALTVLDDSEMVEHVAARDKHRFSNLHNELDHNGDNAAMGEFFLEDENGACVPATFLIAKDQVKSPGYDGKVTASRIGFGGAVQTASCVCLARAIDSMAFGLHDMYASARKVDPKARISNKSVMVLSDKQLAEADVQTLAFGIGSDIKNAYGIKRIDSASSRCPDAKTIRYRTARGAIQFHLYDFRGLSDERASSITKVLDATLGCACVSLLNGYNHPDYSKLGSLPGDYKVTGSGLEYHALSNSWLIHPMVANLVYDFARKCVILGKKDLGKFWDTSEDEVISCMMDLDVDKSRAIMNRNKDIMMKLFQAAWPICNGGAAAGVPDLSSDIPPAKARDIIWDVFQNGIGTLVNDLGDMTTAWTMNGKWIEHSEGDGKNVWRTINEKFGSHKFENKIIY
jgi:hypothetical protein